MRALSIALPAVLCLVLPGVARAAGPLATLSCSEAVRAAERRHSIPTGLLLAIGLVETGRTDQQTGRRAPFPWAVHADNEGHYFDTKEQAMEWVRSAQARGQTSIDVGCLQVNLHFHPHAFANVEDAFDPANNADYAARFLVALQARTGDWTAAAGDYHSQTPARAAPYRTQVAQAMESIGPGRAGDRAQPLRSKPLLAALSAAWGATTDPDPGHSAAGQDLSVPPGARLRLQTAKFWR